MAENQYQWTDNPTVSGVSQCNTDILNDCLMHLKYDNGGLGMPVGTIYPLNCSSSYVPEGSLPTDGAEYTKAQFSGLWNDYLTATAGYYKAYYATNLIPEDLIEETTIIYTTSYEPTVESDFYLYQNGELKLITPETFITVVDVSADKIEFWYGSDRIAEAYRNISKDLNQDLTPSLTAIPLLNTCTYAEYEADIATYGQCAKFAVDTANATFRVPFIKDGAVIQQAMSNGELGKAYNAGLPNITGEFGAQEDSAEKSCMNWNAETYPPTGAFTVTGTRKVKGFAGSSSTFMQADTNGLGFDASLSNSTYGNSDTVQMNAIALRHFVVVATGSINESMMDWSSWASSLQGKLNADLSNINVNQALKNEIVSWGMPDYTAGVTKTKGETYVETIDGFVVVNAAGATSTNKLTVAGYEYNMTTQATGSHGVTVALPVPKGTEYIYTGANPKQYMFFPLKGAK